MFDIEALYSIFLDFWNFDCEFAIVWIENFRVTVIISRMGWSIETMILNVSIFSRRLTLQDVFKPSYS